MLRSWSRHSAAEPAHGASDAGYDQRGAGGYPLVAVREVSLIAALVLISLTNHGAAPAQAQNLAEEWIAQDTATGDWGGLRPELKQDGFDAEVNYTTDILGNPTGGLEQSIAYAGMMYATTTSDLEKLAGLDGLTLVAAAAWTSGRDLSADDIGNLFAVAQVFNGDAVRLSQAYLEQSLFDDRLSAAIGRLSTGDDFAAADSYAYYVNSAVNGNPTGILVNAPSYTTPPFVQWGARAVGQPRDDVDLSLGVYNADPDLQDDQFNGVNFTLNPGKGVLTMAELGYRPTLGDGANGLPGRYSIGGYYDSSDYKFVSDPTQTKSGNYGLYAVVEQKVHNEAGDDDQGLSLWGTLTVNPDDEINSLPVTAYAGAYYEGLFAERPDDVSAFGVYYASFSDELPDQSYELVLELNHRLQLGNWLYLTPDLQGIINPNGGGIPDAFVAGFEMSIDF